MSDKNNGMSLVGHLTELRKRLVWVAAIFMIAMIGGFFLAIPFLDYLKNAPPAVGHEWNAFAPWDGLRVYMQFAFLFAIVISLPVILYQVWAFVKPGLRKTEQSVTLRYIPMAMLLLLMGLSFAYFVVFRMAFYFTVQINSSLGLTETYGIAQYFSFMFNILLPVTLLFELPIVVMFLTRLRILTPERLKKARRYAYMTLVVISTLVTPPDAISAIIVAIPLILLFELSIILSKGIYKKQQARDLAREETYDSEY